ncbi:MAG: hypothetical protein CO090_05620 [Acidobacteria bacterium CG_4_9_14_3_um_filter_49_7]|nr:MAG: hypothetical protein CO090_05620 [Acidobacteria bacterium CG_4_9_14_3_um_filter_49_7]
MHDTYDSTVESTAAFGLKLEQPAKGYRYSIDAFLLAFFASRFPCKKVADFGSGSGIIPLLMAAKSPSFRKFELFELQPELCRYATLNIGHNPMPGREFIVRCEDVRFSTPSLKPNLVVCNPPFRNPKSGRISANRQRALARNWFFLSPSDLFATFLRMRSSENSGLCLVLPCGNYDQWEEYGKMAGLVVTHLLPVHSFPEKEASLMLVRFGTGRKATSEELVVLYERDGTYTKIAREILGFI